MQGNISIKTSDKEDSFSFFKFIHLRAGMDEYEKQVVLQHELIHYQKRHSLDLLVLEVFHSLFWINPLFFYLKKELVNIHEFEVDQEMYKTHKTNYMRHLLNYALGSVDSHYLLTSPFYNRLTITKRIQTMKNNKNKNNFWLLLTIPVLAIGLSIISCENQSIKEEPKKNYTQVLQDQKDAGIELDVSKLNKQPEFKGGVEAMYKFLGENVNYPESAKNNQIEGRVYINFIVTKSGEIKEATVLKGVNDAIDAEALRIINSMPSWNPAEKDNMPVGVAFTLPISFQLADEPSSNILATNKKTGEKIYEAKPSEQPSFVGGQQELHRFMGANIKYPESAKNEGVEGKVLINFTVNPDGTVAFVKVLKGVSKELDDEAVRVVKNMPKWNPAEIDGKPVSSQMTLPIMFALD